MKKYIFLAVMSMLSISCLNKSQFYSSQQVMVTFDYFNGKEVFPDASAMTYSGIFYVGSFNFYTKMSEGETPELLGGVSLCREADTTIFTRKTPYSHFAAFGNPCAEDELNAANVHITYYDSPKSENNPDYALSYAFSYMGSASPRTIDVNNTLEMYATAIGEGELPAFASGDWVKVVFRGYLSGEETGTVEFFLADYTGSEAKLLKEWKTVDISDLGEVDAIAIDIESNVAGIPPYVCLDNFSAIAVVGEDKK